MKKRILSIVLSIVMLVSLLPATALAEGGAQAKWGASAGSLTKEGTLQAAFDAAASDSSITYIQLQSAVALGESETLTVTGGSFTLDLNGQTISGAAYDLVEITGGTITIDDTGSGESGKISGTSNSAVKIKGGTLNLKGGRVEIISANRAATALYISDSSTVEISGGEVYAESTNTSAPYPEAVYIGSADSSLTVSGGSIAAKGPNAESSHASGIRAYKANSLNIAGGSISATVDGKVTNSWVTGIYVPSSGAIGTFTFSNGSINVSGGERTGGIAFYSDQALTISGGLITLNNAGNYAGAVYCYQVGATITVVDNAAFSAPGNVADFNSLNNSAECVKIILQYTNGVSAPEVPYKVKTNSALGIDFTDGWLSLDIPDGDIGKYFTAPATNQKVIKNTATNELQLVEAYTISFSTGGYATNPESQKLLPGEKVTKPVDPVREAHKLNHWCIQYGCSNGAECGDAWDFDTDTVIASDTLYAVWERTHWIVTYNSNGATSGDVPADSNSPYISGSTVTVLGNTGNLAKTGYAFVGWNTWSSGYGTDYAPGATFNINSNTTLYAQWEEYEITTQPTESTPAVGTNADGDIASYQWYKGTMSEVTDTADGVSAYTEDTLTSSYSDGWWTYHEAGGYSTPGYFTIVLNAGDSILAQTSDVINEGQLGIWAAYEKQDWDWTTPDDHFLVTAPADGNYDLHVSDVTYGGGTQPTVKAQVFHIGSTPADGATSKTLVANEDGWYACKITYKDGTVLYSGPVEYEAPSIPVTGVELSESSLTLDVGDTATLTATVLPDDATDKSVSWESSDPTVAKVENGLVTALKPGSTTITATTTDGSLTDTCEVTVNKIAITGTIAITTTQEPTVGQEFSLDYIVIPIGNYSRTSRGFSPDLSIEAGKDYTLSVGLKPNDGYYFADGVAATINGKAATVVRSGDNISIQYTYSFASPAADSVDILLSGISADTAPVVLPGVEQNDVVLPFTAKVLDQYGQEMTGQTVEWSINTTGISVNNGTVTVTEDASEGNYTLTATCDEAFDNVTIKVEKAESVAASVAITGTQIITIPETGSTAVEGYTVKILDQYGDEIENAVYDYGIYLGENSGGAREDVTYDPNTGAVTVKSSAAAGEYIFKVTCTYVDENDNDVDVIGRLQITLVALEAQTITCANVTGTYGQTEELKLNPSGKQTADAYRFAIKSGASTDVVEVASDGKLTIKNAGETTIVVTAPGDATHASASVEVKVTIDKADISEYTAPTANALTYNGSAQALITEGSATGGNMMYAIGTAEQVTGEWSTDTPTGTDIGTYYVWYKIVGDGNHNNKTFETPITVTIAPNTYIVTYLPGINGTGTQTTDTKTQGVVLTLRGAIFTRTGYTQTGWATTDGGAQVYALGASYTADSPITLYPVWTANTNTAYTVEHWQQNVEQTGYVKVEADTENKTGTTGAESEAAAKTYTGFTAQSFDQVAIAADGSTVVKIYYNRNTYTVTYTDNGVFLSNVTFEDVVYGAKAPTYHGTTTRPGYTFGGWYKDSGLTTIWNFENDTINGPTTIYAKWIPAQLSGVVTVTGDAKYGGELTATVSNTNNTGTLSYQWYRHTEHSILIDGATGSTYTVTEDDIDWEIYCVVCSDVQTDILNSNRVGPVPRLTFSEGDVTASGYTGVYDGQNHSITVTVPNGASVYYGTSEETINSSVAPSYCNVGEYTVYYRVGKEKYDSFTGSAKVIITQAAPTVTWPDGTAFVNDTSVTLTGGYAKGVNGEALPGSFTLEAVDLTSAGTKTVKITFAPNSTNYKNVEKTDYSVTVSKRTVESVAEQTAVENAVYGTEQDALGLPASVEITVSGNKKFTVPVTWSGYDATNLNAQTLTGTLDLTDIAAEVQQPDLAITASIVVDLQEKNAATFNYENKTETYNGSSISHEISGTLEGVASISYSYVGSEYAASSTAPTNAGVYEVTATFTMQPGYAAVAPKTATLTISPKEVGLDWSELTGEELVYSGTAKALTATATGLADGDSCTVTVELVGDNINVGTFSYEATALSNQNYKLPVDVSSPEYTITPKTLTITADSHEVYVGSRQPDLTYTVDGLVGDDALTTAPVLTTDANMYRVGAYTITASGADAGDNYSITYVNGTLTVKNYPYIPQPTYDVEIADDITGGEVSASKKIAYRGDTITITVTPDAGYELTALTVTDSRGNTVAVTKISDSKYTFKMPGYDVEIDAVFAKIDTTCPCDWTCPMYGYTDLDRTLWYHDGIHYCIEHGLMVGTGTNIFEPNIATSRAMIVTILWRLEGSPIVNYAMDFEDVAADQWYTEAIRWAASEKIVEGYGNGKFGTNDAITREQFVTIMFRYAKYKGYDVSVGENTNILSYDDAFDVAEWAIPAMQWACGAGMIQGIADGNQMNLAPQGNATRAQAAAILQRYCENVADKE